MIELELVEDYLTKVWAVACSECGVAVPSGWSTPDKAASEIAPLLKGWTFDEGSGRLLCETCSKGEK